MPLTPRPGGALGTSLWKIEAMDRARSIDLVDGMPILELDGPFSKLTSNPCFEFSGIINPNVAAEDIELWIDNIAAVVKRVG